MKRRKLALSVLITAVLSACSLSNAPLESSAIAGLSPQVRVQSYPISDSGEAILGNPNYLAISYGAWRHALKRESGASVPSLEEQKEDMRILHALGIKMLRTYNTQAFRGLDGKTEAENLLEAIKQLKQEDENFEMYVMLGVWMEGENAWSGKPVLHDAPAPSNHAEIEAAKALALAYSDIVKVIAVGNEAMVSWAPYHVTPRIILAQVEHLQAWKKMQEQTKDLWITTSENWAVWAGIDANGNVNEQRDLKALIKAVDYVSLHTYAHHDTFYHPEFKESWKVPANEQSLPKLAQIDSAMTRIYDYTLGQIQQAQTFINTIDASKPIHIGETGWATVSSEMFGKGGTQAADEYKQKRFYDDMRAFTNEFGASLFYFQAFDERWKGDASNPGHSEQHFGLIDLQGRVKYLAWDKVETLNSLGLSRGEVKQFTPSYDGNVEALLNDVLPPPHAN